MIEKRYRDTAVVDQQRIITIQATDQGWAILYPTASNVAPERIDETDTAENNLSKALTRAKAIFPCIEEVGAIREIPARPAMKRMFGLMPRSEIEIEKRYGDGVVINGRQLYVTLQAGKRGWTILFADQSTEYQDGDDTTENNLAKAIVRLKEIFPNAEEVKDEKTQLSEKRASSSYHDLTKALLDVLKEFTKSSGINCLDTATQVEVDLYPGTEGTIRITVSECARTEGPNHTSSLDNKHEFYFEAPRGEKAECK